MSHALACVSLSEVPERTIRSFKRRMSTVTPNANGCLVWPGFIDEDGYGLTRFKMSSGSFRRLGTHRLAMLIAHGDLEPGLVTDHLCRTRSCCNPEHLRMVTNAENIRAGFRAIGNYNSRKTYCTNGHELFGDNLHIIRRSNRPDTRCCRKCRYDAKRRYLERQRTP